MWMPFCLLTAPRSVLAAHCCKLTLVSQKQWMSNSKIKMTKTLQKMFDKGGGAKKKLYPSPVTTMFNKDVNFEPKKKPVYTEGQKRRAHQVGQVLYNNVVQIINSGQLCPQLVDLAVEIVRVKVVPNFSAVNIYWMASGSEEDDKVQRLLHQHEGALRHILTSYYILGQIPHLTFVRDDSRAHYRQVERLLSTADFGPDFEPSQLTTSIRSDVYYQRSKDACLSNSNNSAADQLQHDLNQLNYDNNLADFSNKNLSQTTSELNVSHLMSNIRSCEALFDAECTKTDSFGIKEQSPARLEKKLQTGFRDDLYGVAHTELMKKVLAGKKTRLRPSSHAADSQDERSFANSLKGLVSRKHETKGRPLSDYHYLAMQNWREGLYSADVLDGDIDDEN